MLCPKCDFPLVVNKSYLTFANDTTPDAPTEAFRNLDMVCVNKICANYAGADLQTPKVIVETVQHREV